MKWHERMVFLRVIFFVLMIALAAGATAALMVLAWYPSIIGVGSGRTLITNPPVFTTRTPPSVDSGRLARAIEQSTVRVYRASDAARILGVELYPTETAVGRAAIITADGWLLTTSAVAQASTDLRILDERGRVYRMEKQVRDVMTGLSFIKIAADGLPVAPVADREVPTIGAFVYGGSGGAVTTHAIGPAVYNQREPLSNDRMTRFLSVASAAAIAEGAPLFTPQGLLLGIVHRAGDATVVLPVTAVRRLFDDVFAGKTIAAPLVRITYVLLPDVVPTSVGADQQAPRVGAYVLRVQRATGYRGPLPSLEQGDIITAVNDEPITQHETLALLLARLR
ncbi:MAG: S1C family serine protease, partial [Patescibacteria group bacterium]